MQTEILRTLERLDDAARLAVEAFNDGADDGTALRAGFLIAGTFARFCAHARVWEAERSTIAYVTRGEVPAVLPTQRMASIADMERRYSAAKLLRLYGERSAAEQLADVVKTKGIAACKGAFWLAVAGFSDLPCIDTHIATRYGVSMDEVAGLYRLKPEKQAERYLDVVKRVRSASPYPRYGRMEQWSDYADIVPAFADGGHEGIVALVTDAYRGRVRYAPGA